MIHNYFAQIKSVADRYSSAPFVVKTELTFETRSGGQGYIRGRILFTDDSELYFKEYLDQISDKIDKIMYSYHYQNANKQLLFRYDNACHRPALAWNEHKHVQDQIIISLSPDLESVLLEIYEKLNKNKD